MTTTRKGTPAEPVFSADVGDLTLNTANQYLQQRQIAWIEQIGGDITDAVNSTIAGSVSLSPDGSSRVSQRTILGDYKHHYGAQTLFMDSETIGTGAISYQTTESLMRMTTAADGDVVVHQSKQGHNYQSGNPQSIECTFDNFHLQTNVVKRVGYYSSSQTSPWTANLDGVYLESDGLTDNTFKFVVIKSGVVTASINKENWDDPLDGTGASGVNYSFDKFTIILIDFLWLGGSEFRLFVKTSAGFTLCHTYKHAGLVSGVSILTPIQPIRYEIRQTGGGAGTFDMICARAATEGGINKIGQTACIATEQNTVNANAIANLYAIVGYKLQTNGSRFVETFVSSISLVETSGANNVFHWELLLNPTVAGTFNFSDITNSPLQGAAGDTSNNPSTNTVTGGTVIACGYGVGKSILEASIESSLKIGSFIDSGSGPSSDGMDEIVLAVRPMTSNQDVAGSMTIFIFS